MQKRRTTRLHILLLSFFTLLAASASSHNTPHSTIYVAQGRIFTAAGEPLVMRGFNEMFVWSSDKTGERWLPEMAKTGANSVRLVWDHEDTAPQDLVTLIERSIEHKMVAIPECHNATGKWGDELQACIHFWNNPLLIEAIERNRQWTILNIANEAGDHDVSDADFIKVYSEAITLLRQWGYTVPIMIDASGWGQNLPQLLAVGPQLQAADPLGNIIFSAHSYWAADIAIDYYHKTARAPEAQGIAVIIGEGPSVTRVGQCDDKTPLPYLEGMKILQEAQIGWLNWSWGGARNGDCDDYLYFDITHKGEFGAWQHEPGAQIVALSPYGVMQTSVRPASMYKEGKVQVSGVYVQVDTPQLAVGESTAFNVLVAPVNAHNKAYKLRVSGDKRAVSINTKQGTITARKPGKVHLEAITRDGKLRWSQALEVRP